MNSLIAQIENELSDPSKWKLTEHCLEHVGGTELWIANGFWFLSVWRPVKLNFSFAEKVRLWVRVRRLLKSMKR